MIDKHSQKKTVRNIHRPYPKDINFVEYNAEYNQSKFCIVQKWSSRIGETWPVAGMGVVSSSVM